MDPRLLLLIKKLCTHTSCQVEFSPQGNSQNPDCKGVIQGCKLAPSLFIFFYSNVAPSLSKIDGPFPKILHYHILVLLYVDNGVLFLCSQIGLRRQLHQCLTYFNNNRLTLNFGKTKILAFAKSWKQSSWKPH